MNKQGNPGGTSSFTLGNNENTSKNKTYEGIQLVEIGPHDWKPEKLSEACHVQSGLSWSKEQEVESPEEGDIPVIKIDNVADGKLELEDPLFLRDVSNEKIEQNKAEENWIVMIGSNGSKERIAKCGMIHEDMEFVYASFLYGIKPRTGSINPYFLYNFLNSEKVQNRLQSFTAGSTSLNNLNKSELEKIVVPTPELREQKQIASVLYNVNQAIQKTEEIIEQTQRVKKGLLQKLVFKTEDENSIERRFGPKLFEVDSSWEKVRLKEVADIITRGKQPKYSDEGKPVVNQECIYWDGFHPENLKTLDEEAAKEWKDKYFANKGDVLINSTGQGTLGRATVLQKYGKIPIDSHVTRVKPDSDRLDPRFFRYFLEHKQGQGLLYSMCVSGSTGQIELSKTKLQLFTFPLPPLSEQKEISDKLELIDEGINSNKQFKKQLQFLKKGLMQDLLTGKVRTNEDVEVLEEVVEYE